MTSVAPIRRRATHLAGAWSVGVALAMAAGLLAPAAAPTAMSAAAAPTIPQLIGQKLVVRMDGTTPSADLLGRIRRGEIGGVILFSPNITTPVALTALVAKLQAAATAGGQRKLLIAVDQEGGSVRRIPWAPPTLSARQMGGSDDTTKARDQGLATGTALRDLGINVDFAPVADVPSSTSQFEYIAGRTFSRSAIRTASMVQAFSTSLLARGVLPTLKHFPGIGFAIQNTDSHVVTIRASAVQLSLGLRPFRTGIAAGVPLIMLSNATYTAYNKTNAAGWSGPILRLLRNDLGFRGVTITDSLDGTAAARHVTPASLAIRAATAGTDMILTTGSESQSKVVYAQLVQAAQSRKIPMSNLLASYSRILTLKSHL